MAEWKYYLETSGREFRKAFNEGYDSVIHCCQILKALEDCITVLKQLLPASDYHWYFQDAEIDLRYYLNRCKDAMQSPFISPDDFSDIKLNTRDLVDQFWYATDKLQICVRE